MININQQSIIYIQQINEAVFHLAIERRSLTELLTTPDNNTELIVSLTFLWPCKAPSHTDPSLTHKTDLSVFSYTSLPHWLLRDLCAHTDLFALTDLPAPADPRAAGWRPWPAASGREGRRSFASLSPERPRFGSGLLWSPPAAHCGTETQVRELLRNRDWYTGYIASLSPGPPRFGSGLLWSPPAAHYRTETQVRQLLRDTDSG